MKKIILNFEKKCPEFKELVQEAFNKDILNFLISKETYPEFETIEGVNLYSKDLDISSDYKIYTDRELLDKKFEEWTSKENLGFFKELRSKDDEIEIKDISNTGQVDFIIVSAKDWKIIPFENLIAEMHSHKTEIIASVEDVKEAQVMLNTLEIGVDGIVMTPKDAKDIVDLKNIIRTEFNEFNVELTKGKIIAIQSIPESHRVCVDTSSILNPGEGMLVGSTAMGFALIHAEVFDTQFVASRPFRVNAGDVSAYILVPSEDPENIYRTRYLSELKGGDKVLVVDTHGEARIVYIGRAKIEVRPMLRFELEIKKGKEKIPMSCICQNAETVLLVDANEMKAKSVVDIKVGDEILVHIGPKSTHFGTIYKENILEK